jgi:hypothetical protein
MPSNSLSNIDIIKIIQKHKFKHFHGVYSKDLLPQHLQIGWYIINMEDSNDGNGTHWTCFHYTIDKMVYFDSFGFIYPDTLKNRSTNIIYNHKEIQNYYSSACGWFCLSFMFFDKYTDIDLKLKRFQNRFSNITNLNDNILDQLLHEENLI